MIKKREEVKSEDKWNVEALFKTPQAWQEAFLTIANQTPLFKEAVFFKGKLATGPENFKKAFETILDLSRSLSKLFTYAHLRHDEDITNDEFKVAFAQISSLFHAFSEAISWFEPEIIAMNENTLNEILKSPLFNSLQICNRKNCPHQKTHFTGRTRTTFSNSGKSIRNSSPNIFSVK